jgi:hypothetical protein
MLNEKNEILMILLFKNKIRKINYKRLKETVQVCLIVCHVIVMATPINVIKRRGSAWIVVIIRRVKCARNVSEDII